MFTVSVANTLAVRALGSSTRGVDRGGVGEEVDRGDAAVRVQVAELRGPADVDAVGAEGCSAGEANSELPLL